MRCMQFVRSSPPSVAAVAAGEAGPAAGEGAEAAAAAAAAGATAAWEGAVPTAAGEKSGVERGAEE